MGKSKHSIEEAKTSLEIEEQLEAHKKGWAAQSIGLALIFILVVTAAAGVFGDGPVSKHRASAEQITVESERFSRFHARKELKVHVANSSSDGVTVTFPSHYLQKLRIESIVPEPKENSTRNGEVSYSFAGVGSMDITFYLEPQSQGTLEGTMFVNGKPFPLKTFIFP